MKILSDKEKCNNYLLEVLTTTSPQSIDKLNLLIILLTQVYKLGNTNTNVTSLINANYIYSSEKK